MDIRSAKRLFSFAYQYFIKGEPHPEVIPYKPQKTRTFLGAEAKPYFPRVSPESVGVDSAHIEGFLHTLESGALTNVNSVLVIQDGKCIAEGSAPGYSALMPHTTFSMAKSVTALAIGLLCDEGRLSPETPLLNIFPEYAAALRGKRRTLTVGHLLSMGVKSGFSDFLSIVEEHWLDAYFDALGKDEPGSVFSYNSMTTYVLAAILTRISGESLDTYIEKRLFRPMGIRAYTVEKSPEGICKGGFGMYLAPEDMAKFGMLVLDRGVFAGQRYLSEKWIEAMTAVNNHPDKSFGDYGYGYQVWVGETHKTVLFNGMLGQDVLVIPKTRTVVVLTAGNRELFQHSQMLEIAERYFVESDFCGERKRKNRRAERSLRAAEKHFYRHRAFVKYLPQPSRFRAMLLRFLRRPVRPLPHAAQALGGKCFLLSPNNLGLLPLFPSIMQNNFGGGIESLAFSVEGERLLLTFAERSGNYSLPVGFYEPLYTAVDMNGEAYTVAVSGECVASDEPRLKLTFTFPELSSERHFTLYGPPHAVRVSIEETPGAALCEPLVAKLEGSAKGALGLFMAYLPIEAMKARVEASFNPVLLLSEAEQKSERADKKVGARK